MPPQSQKFIKNDKFEVVTHEKYFSPMLHRLHGHSPAKKRAKSAKMRSGPILKQDTVSHYHFAPHLPGATSASIIPEEEELLSREIKVHESDRKIIGKLLETGTENKGAKKQNSPKK